MTVKSSLRNLIHAIVYGMGYVDPDAAVENVIGHIVDDGEPILVVGDKQFRESHIRSGIAEWSRHAGLDFKRDMIDADLSDEETQALAAWVEDQDVGANPATRESRILIRASIMDDDTVRGRFLAAAVASKFCPRCDGVDSRDFRVGEACEVCGRNPTMNKAQIADANADAAYEMGAR